MKRYSGVYNQLIGLGVLIIAILLSRYFPTWIENHYSLVIFPKLNTIIQFFTSWFPFPLFFPFHLLLLYKYITSLRRHKRSFSFTLELTLKYVLFFFTCFYLLWGFNYQRLNIREKLTMKDDIVADSMIVSTFVTTTKSLNQLAEQLKQDTITTKFQEEINVNVMNSVRNALVSLGYPGFKVGKLKPFWPKGLLLCMSTSGFYFPFTGEAYYDKGLHPYQMPFALCHEYAHAQGFADEGDCNFIAYLACSRSNIPLFQYSADIALFKTIRSLSIQSDVLRQPDLSDKVKQDLLSISKEMEKYPDYFPELRDKLYDMYLKLQGIKEGENNYNSFVQLLIKYNRHNSNENK